MKLMSIVPWTKGYTNDAGPFLSFAILDSDTGESFLHTGRLSGYSWRDRKLTCDSIYSSPPFMDVDAYHPDYVLCYAGKDFLGDDPRPYPHKSGGMSVLLDELRSDFSKLLGNPDTHCFVLTERHMETAFGKMMETDDFLFLAFANHLNHTNAFERFAFGVCLLWESYCGAERSRQEREKAQQKAQFEADLAKREREEAQREAIAEEQRQKTLQLLGIAKGEEA